MKKRNKDARKKNKRGGWLKWFVIAFIALMFIGAMNSEDSDTTITATDNETEKVSSEAEESKQAEESLTEEKEAKEEEERLAKEEEERLEQGSIEAEEERQEELDNARTDVTYDNLMRTPDDYLGQVVKLSGTVIQTNTGDGVVQQRVALNDNYDQAVLIEYSEDLPEVRLLDDDYITFTGMAFGTIEYETVLGSTLEIPSIIVERINIE